VKGFRSLARRLLGRRASRWGRRLGIWGVLGLLALPNLLNLRDGVRSHPDAYAGLPRAQQISLLPWSAHWFHVIDPPGFVLGYSERLRNPLWVAYRLDDKRAEKLTPRPKHFSMDTWTLMRVDAHAYRHAGYDRGHMAPNYAMSQYAGRAAQLASFRMSNIVPQRGALNQKLWQRLEEVETDVYAQQAGPLWVVTGPIFAPAPPRLPSGVAVPEAFFRIWLRQNDAGAPEVLAFVVPQTVTGYEPLDQFLVTVDAVEALSGLDFFHIMQDAAEADMEARLDPIVWAFERYARRPPRY
jgi:endonuclease G